MDTTSQFNPFYLYILGAILFLAAILAAWKIPARWRIPWLIVWLVPAIGLLVVAQHLQKIRREVERQSLAIFSRITPNAELCETEIATLNVLATNSPVVREEVMRLAFANKEHAADALPRLELLLHCVLQSDPTGQGHEDLWQKIVKPALRKNPPREVILLAAATAYIGGYGKSEADVVLPKLCPLFAGETNSNMRILPLGVFAPLAEFATGDQLERAANLLLPEVLKESNLVTFQTWLPKADPVPTRDLKELFQLVDHLSGPAARRFADEVLPAMAAATNVSRTIALGKMLAAMKADLNATEMNSTVSNLALRWPGDRDFFWQLGGLLASLATVMTPEQASNCVSSVLAGLEAQPEPWWPERPDEPLKTLATRLNKEDLLKLAGPMAAKTPAVMETVRDRISEEEAFDLMVKLEQTMLDTPNAKKRSAQVPGIQSLAVCFSPEPAGVLANQLWHLYLRDQDGQRRNDEADCLTALLPRINQEQAASFAKLVVERMKQSGEEMPMLVKILTPLLGRCNPATVQEAVACVMEFKSRPKFVFQPAERLQKDFLTSTGMTSPQVESLLEPYVAGFENYDNPQIYMLWAVSLAPVAGQLTPKQMERVANRLVFLYTQRFFGSGPGIHEPYLDVLGTNVNFNPKQSKRIFDIVFPEFINNMSYWMDPFTKSVIYFSQKLDSAAAESASQTIISASSRALFLKNGSPFRSYGEVLRAKSMMQNGAECLSNMAARLQSDQAERLAGQLLQMTTNYGNHPGFVVLLDAAKPPAPAGWQLPWEFVEHQEQRYDNYVLGSWSQSVGAMISRVSKADAEKIADQIATRLAQQADLGPLAFDEPTARLLQYASEPVLREILTKPCAVGGLRQIVLDAWELKTGKPFKNEIWKLSAWTANTNSG